MVKAHKIPLSKDAYGQEVWAFFRGQESYEIIERDDGFIGLSSGSPAYYASFRYWPVHQKEGMRFVRGKVLDVGCGVGRVSLHLEEKGFDVVGIDNSPLAIRICEERGMKDAHVMGIERIGGFKPGTFGTIVMYGNNFGLFGGYAKAKRLLKTMHRITTPTALIVAESNDPYMIDDIVHTSYHAFNRRRGRMGGQLRIRVRFKKFIGEWFDYLIVSKKEMKDIVSGTGWHVRAFINSEKSSYIAVLAKD